MRNAMSCVATAYNETRANVAEERREEETQAVVARGCGGVQGDGRQRERREVRQKQRKTQRNACDSGATATFSNAQKRSGRPW